MIPSVMSIAIEIAVPWAAPATVTSRMPGQDVGGVFGAATGHAAQAGPERSAEDEHEQQQEDDRDAGDEERQRGVAAHPAEVAPEHRRRVGQDERIGVHRTARFLVSCVVAGQRQEDVVEVGGLDREPADVDRAGVEPVEERPQRADPAVARDLEGRAPRRRATRHRTMRAARSSSAASANESRMWPPGHQPLELVRRPLGDEHPVVEDGDPMREPVRLLEVLRRQEDRDAACDEVADDVCHMTRRLRGSRPAVGSSRKMIRGSPIRVIARSSRRFMPPE